MSNTLRLRTIPTIGLSPVGSWRGDWTANTDYKYLDFVTDPVTANVYAGTTFFTSGSTIADDVSAGNFVVVIDVTGIVTDVRADIIGVNKQTGTTYTLQSSDNGQIVTLNNAGAIALTLPNSLAEGFNCVVGQEGAGQITVAAAGGATMQSPGGATKSAVRYGMISAFVFSNAGGTTASWRLTGDLTP